MEFFSQQTEWVSTQLDFFPAVIQLNLAHLRKYRFWQSSVSSDYMKANHENAKRFFASVIYKFVSQMK